MSWREQLRLAVETEEERRARLENDAAYQTAQVGWLWRRTKREKQDWRRW